jgi:hypothetical protein
MNHLKSFDYRELVDMMTVEDQFNGMWDDFPMLFSKFSVIGYEEDAAQTLTSMRQDDSLIRYSLGKCLAMDVPDGVQWIADTSTAYGEAVDEDLEDDPIGWDGLELKLAEELSTDGY